MNPKKAFTLIELLLVIAIIGILSALLFPIITSANAKVKRITCLNNLRQINLGVRMYSEDSNDLSPKTPGTARSPGLNWTGYKQLMKSYVGLNSTSSSQESLFACPADKFYYDTHNQLKYVPDSFHKQTNADYSSYLFNGGNLNTNRLSGLDWPGIAGRTLSSIKDPVKTVLVAEFPAFFPYSWHQPKSPPTPLFNDAENMLSFVDGHVSFIRIYWNTNRFLSGGVSYVAEACNYDPPAGYDYKWSGD